MRPLFEVIVDRPNKSDAVEQRRAELPRQEIDAFVDGIDDLADAGETLGCGLVAANYLRPLKSETERDQELPDVVVQVAGNASPLVLLGDDEAVKNLPVVHRFFRHTTSGQIASDCR